MPHFTVYLAREKNGHSVKRLDREAQTHVLAAKIAQAEYPELVVNAVLVKHELISFCARCGGPIFKADYHKDQIRQRNDSNRCLDCL
ncbi:hypothetical protein F1728_15790 [Gimesia benthica]|uniref:Uncharacterized protein n=1 Tax=Gimesia benthica TaxID=2608982 RepID=A0A6I6AGZ5_9PLAN|nr:hypothetical protein [Gimesia benthica]QGQ24059.1 hypothetical protein F1728_15790 [Gimesia benthica]